MNNKVTDPEYTKLHGEGAEVSIMYCNTHKTFHILVSSFNSEEKMVITNQLEDANQLEAFIAMLQQHLEFMKSPERQLLFVQELRKKGIDMDNKNVILH